MVADALQFGIRGALLRLRWNPIRLLPGVFLGLIPIFFCGIHSIPTVFFGNKMTEVGLTACLKKMPVSPDDVVVTGRREIAAVA